MGDARQVDAMCAVCDEVQVHVIQDPGSCACTVCGTVQQMMVPVA